MSQNEKILNKFCSINQLVIEANKNLGKYGIILWNLLPKQLSGKKRFRYTFTYEYGKMHVICNKRAHT